ncbi:MAG: serine/threonine protein kinase, partial [Cyanobacteria bacterium]|nr:serine/threonine protein kinase [Cyanobacteriota bacterium]
EPLSSNAEEEQEEYLDLPPDEFPMERYRPIKILGQGMSGSVVMCRDTTLDMKVAIKVLHFVDEAALVSFHREAKLVSTLTHRNLISVLDFGVTDKGRPYMVMPYREGITLSQWIRENGPLDTHTALVIVRKICTGLSSAHLKGVFHRDIKPDNILVSDLTSNPEDAEVFLFDFGIALTDISIEESKRSQGQTLIGTPPYMSPDQIVGRKFDARSDIYSLGCVLFELLTGYPPFQGDSVFEIMEKHAAEAVPPLPNCNDELSEAAEVIVNSALEKDPDNRYQSMDEMGAAIDLALGNSTSSQWSITVGSIGSRIMTRINPKKDRHIARTIVIASVVATVIASFFIIKGLNSLNQNQHVAKKGVSSNTDAFPPVDAIDELRNKEESSKEKIASLSAKAEEFAQKKQFDKAVKTIITAEKIARPASPERADLLFQHAKLLADQGKNDEAIAQAHVALSIWNFEGPLKGRYIRLIYWLAAFYHDIGRDDESWKYVQLGTKTRQTELPSISPVATELIYRGDSALEQQKPKEAKG